MREEVSGKASVQCDYCKTGLDPKDDIHGENIKAVFPGPKGDSRDYHFCNHKNCLRMWLNDKAKAIRKSKAAEFINGSWELNYEPIEFTHSALWPKKAS